MQLQREHSEEEVITALQQQVDDLAKANLFLKEQLARKEQFIAMIAHELRGPLTPIINYARIVARPNQRPEMIERGTSIIVGLAHRLTRLVNDLLDASHLSSGRFTLTKSACDIVALTKEVVEQLRPLAPHHTLVLGVPAAPITGNWDSGRIQQALGNLLDNAVKYSNEGTTITVRISSSAATVQVSVHNQGASIPTAEINQLFRPYVRLQAASGRQGSGLGLYITRCIIEAHGGTLRLELPDAEEQGTTFSFDLPLHD